jgi:hypothetical protein
MVYALSQIQSDTRNVRVYRLIWDLKAEYSFQLCWLDERKIEYPNIPGAYSCLHKDPRSKLKISARSENSIAVLDLTWSA